MILKVPQDKSLPSNVMTSADSESLVDVNLRNDHGPDDQRSFPCRSFPKRKPEKNKIIRLTKHDDYRLLRCENCIYEALSLHDLNNHKFNCPKKLSETFNDVSIPERLHDNSNKEDDKNLPDSCNQMIKLLQQSPSTNGMQQMALETMMKAQMSLSRLALNYENKEEHATKETNPYSLISQQLLQFQIMQLLQAQVTMQSEKSSPVDNMSDHEEMNESTLLKRSPTPQAEKSNVGLLRCQSTIDDEDKLKENTNKNENSICSMIIHHSESPPPKGLNALEMLQRTADDVLNNASKGLLTNRLIDSVGDGDSKDHDIRHRCRYCGKVFSSDSALQIHIRSHTGERPFKCNICGNRFTTRGNLKVHFQRHSDRFPHIKMNHNPVPEHLDKFYPPLLQNAEDENMTIDPPVSFSLPNPSTNILSNNIPLSLSQELVIKELKERIAQSIGLENTILDLKRFSGNSMQDLIAKIEMIKANTNSNNDIMSDEEMECSDRQRSLSPVEPIKEEIQLQDEPCYMESTSLQNEKTEERLKVSPKYGPPSHSIDSLLSKKTSEVEVKSRRRSGSLEKQNEFESECKLVRSQESHEAFAFGSRNYAESENEDNDINRLYEQKGNDVESCCSDANPENEHHQKISSSNESSPIEFSHFPFLGMPMPPKLSVLQGMGIPSPPLSNGVMMLPSVDPAKNPTVYSNLLPRPGSNDNSWEALIEIDQSDEKQKVQALMGKSKVKPTEPNQCGVCLRVLSCKSALHMHYRVHTGERPFKCRICCRAFTTKGNLKTHMSVHRAKPPMRMFHQCTVCHKKFSNALILQQHIRLHTGEPTDLSLEQIAAGEIRDMPMDMPLPFGFPQFSPNGLQSPIPPRVPFSPMLLPFPLNSHQRVAERDLQGGKQSRSSTGSPRSLSGSSSEHQVAEDLSLRSREEANLDTVRSTASPMSSDYSDVDEKSGAQLTDQREIIPKSFGNTPSMLPSLPPETNVKSLFPSIFSPRGSLSHLKSNLNCISPQSEPLATKDTDSDEIIDTQSRTFLSPFAANKKLYSEPHSSILPLPASLSIPSSISHLPFQSRFGSFHLPFPSHGSLHLS